MENVKLILLRERNEVLLGSVTELDEEPSLLVTNCMEILKDGTLEPFPRFAAQRDLFLTSEAVLTIVDPSPEIVETYSKV